MKVKFTFNVPSNGHTAQLVLEAVCDKSPLIMSGNYWFNILPIDSYQIMEEESTDDCKMVFLIEKLLNKNQLVVRPVSGTDLFFMTVPEIIEQ